MSTMPERLRAMIELTLGPRVLHVGCVGGKLPETDAERTHWVHGALLDAGYSVLGTDIQRDALDRMRAEGYEAAYLDAQAIPPDGERFDTIFAGELIEHLENPGLFLTGARARLKPGGRLVISTPNVWSPMYALHFAKNPGLNANPEHTVWFDARVLTELLRRSGYRVERLVYCDDLRADAITGKPFYTAYARTWLAIRRFLPARYRNDMVVCAVPAD